VPAGLERAVEASIVALLSRLLSPVAPRGARAYSDRVAFPARVCL